MRKVVFYFLFTAFLNSKDDQINLRGHYINKYFQYLLKLVLQKELKVKINQYFQNYYDSDL